ncbi:hypothetical protein LCGC14_0264860 [marine sediment metagenome]|uniref:Uncharacterized protein n=1 Tax=marine sediment metagenome TaxID=412755 RepID=A0A0F9X5T2_9ZZZZ
MAAPRKITDPVLLEALMDIRVTEQVPWRDMPERYLELTGEEVDWKTIRTTLMREYSLELLPERVNKFLRESIDSNTSEVQDVMKLSIMAYNIRFVEWLSLVERQKQSEIDKQVESEDPSIEFNEQDYTRMDMLWNELMGFNFRMMEMLKSVQGETFAVNIFSGGSKENDTGVVVEGSGNWMENIVDKVAATTKQLVVDIDTRHKEEVRGNHRVLPSMEEDLLEEDV